MKKEDVSRAVSMLDDDLIAEAVSYKPKKFIDFSKVATLAASLILVALISFPAVRDVLNDFDLTATGEGPNSTIGVTSTSPGTDNEDPNANMPAPSLIPLSTQTPKPAVTVLPKETDDPGFSDGYEGNNVYYKVLQVEESSILFVLKYTESTPIELNLNVTDKNGNQTVVSNSANRGFFDYFISKNNEDYVENGAFPSQGSYYVKVNYSELLRKGYVTDGYLYISNYAKIKLHEN